MTDLWEMGGDINRPDGFIVVARVGSRNRCWRLTVDAWTDDCVDDCPVDTPQARQQLAIERGEALAREWQAESGKNYAGFWRYSADVPVYGVTWRMVPMRCPRGLDPNDEDLIDLRPRDRVGGRTVGSDAPAASDAPAPSEPNPRRRRTPRPRRAVQEDKVRELLADLDRRDWVTDQWATPEGEHPPPDVIFETNIWANCRVQNPDYEMRKQLPRLSVASLGAYTQRQAERFQRFLQEFYEDQFPDLEVEAVVEQDWAFEFVPALAPDWLFEVSVGARRLIDRLLRAVPQVTEAIEADPALRQLDQLVSGLQRLESAGLLGQLMACPELLSTLLPTDTTNGLQPWVVATEVTRHYGGHEEGGWWFNHSEPVAVMLVSPSGPRRSVMEFLRETYEDAIAAGDISSVLGGAQFVLYRSNRPPVRSRTPPAYE